MAHARLLSIVVALSCAVAVCSADSAVLLREDFDSLDAWRPLEFPKIPEHSTYTIAKDGTNDVLKAESHGSASGIVRTNTYDVTQAPVLHWRWKTDTVYKKGDATRKDGDDYPIRVYVIFKYDPSRAGFVMRAKYGLAKKFYGEYPPHSGLNYIWANRTHDKRLLVSPYTDRAIMVVQRSGTKYAGEWVEETVNVLDDYREAFGEPPPPEASLAIMNDSDNTGESAVSYIDFIEVLGPDADREGR